MTASTTRNSDHTGPPAPHPPVSGGPIVQLPTAFGDFVAQAWTDLETGHEHLAVSSPRTRLRVAAHPWYGCIPSALPVMCSVPTAATAENSWLSHWNSSTQRRNPALPARPGGPWHRAGQQDQAYALQEAGFDTVEANEQLGLPVDARSYAAAGQILAEMGLHEVRLLSNNPDKQHRLDKAGGNCCGDGAHRGAVP